MTHLGMLVIFAALVSIVFAVLARDDLRDQLRFGGRIFAAFVVGGWIAGWVMLGVFG